MKIKISKQHGNVKESAVFSYENFEDTMRYAQKAQKAVIEIDLKITGNILLLEEIVNKIIDKVKADNLEAKRD